jgi:pilus assembly protein CpaC
MTNWGMKGDMANRTMARATTLWALIVSIGLASIAPVIAAEATNIPIVQVAASEATSRFIPLGIGKSVIIDLPADIKDVLVADPKIANAVIRSSRRAYMIGVAVGQTNIFFFDADGKQIAGFDIAVKRDLNGVRAALKQAMPDADIRIEGIGDGVMLSGSAASAVESQQAYDLATRLAGDSNKVVNGIAVRGRDQVMLKVTVAEVQRDVVKQLGVDLSANFTYGATVVSFNNTNPFSASGQPLNPSFITGYHPPVTTDPLSGLTAPRIGATVRAMERAGIIRTLAEPNLTAISGETAHFLVGGEFPFPVPGNCATCPPSVEFKKFGVGLVFTPVVLSEGRISLKVMTEVSEISTENQLSLAGTTVPSLVVRRAETTLEVPSGGALAMAGMIKEQTRQAINGLPGLMQVPVLGVLFKSRDFINNQTELMILVTPYVVRAVAQKQLSRPDDGFADPNDPQSILLGQLSRIYGVAGKADVRSSGEYHGKYGFILD